MEEFLFEIFGCSFTKQEDIDGIRRFYSQSAYCLNADGQLIGLACRETNKKEVKLGEAFQHLQYLNISGNKELREMRLNAEMRSLRHLDLSDNALKTVDLPDDLDQVAHIDISRNGLQQFFSGPHLPALSFLDLSKNQLQSLELNAPGLKYAYLLDNQLEQLDFRSIPSDLEVLHLKNNQLSELPNNLNEFSSLHSLFLHGNPLPGIPKEIISTEENGNSYVDVWNYIQDLGQGTIINYRAKLILVGNGRVGKTSLFRRLAGQPYNRAEKYTHGVQIGELTKEHLPDVETEALQLKTWDFGGQDIFYATHQFFLSDEAVYILAWTAPENVEGYRERDQDELPFDEKWRSCEYWLENIRLHAKESPIVMVQTHSDIIQYRQENRSEWSRSPFAATITTFSAAKDLGLPELKLLLSDRLNQAIPMLGKEFPRNYEHVISTIEKLKRKGPSISRDVFESICGEAGVVKGGEETLLDYLHKSGVIVHFKQELLQDVIYIDPNWLTEQVYLLINNKLRLLKGRIKQDYLVELLPAPEFDDKSRAQLMALLVSFELIFLEEGEEKSYIAPQYLPDQLESEAKDFHDDILESLSLAFVFRFPKFLPDNVVINFWSRYGPYSRRVYWKNGIYFSTENKAKCIVHFDEVQRCLKVYTTNDEIGKKMQKEICEAFVKLSKNANAEISLDGQVFASWQELNKYAESPAASPSQQFYATNGKTLLFLRNFAKFFDKELYHPIREKPKIPEEDQQDGAFGKMPTSQSKIYFSYSWDDQKKDGADQEKMVDRLYEALQKEGLNVLRDNMNIEYGGLISKYMEELGKGDLIVVFVSDNYARSPYCMFELYEIARNSKWERTAFSDRILIVPIERQPVRFDNPEVLAKYLDYWEEQYKKWERLVSERLEQSGESTYARFQKTKVIKQEFSRLSDWLIDINAGSVSLLSEDDFHLVKETIQKRLVGEK